MVFFTDKANTPYSISQPGDFLTQRAISRRLQQNVAITEQDLPVNPGYVSGVKETGAQVFFTTRWMNGVLVQCDEELVPMLEGLDFVNRVEFVAPDVRLLNGRRKTNRQNKSGRSADVTDIQLTMLGITTMHSEGYRGEGIIIAVFDSGFDGVDTGTPFQHLWDENKIDLSVSQDFVYNSDNVFGYDDHGTMVFSVMAANESMTFTGGSYNANFQLYITEEVPTEYRVEEYNWLFAAERADSTGADIIQASLGYNDFDGTTMDYEKSAMNGTTTVVTRAAQWATDRGMVVVCSAGNEGNNSWQTITAPADATDVLAVANVNQTLQRSNSSSIGPSFDGRVKPDVAALGTNTSVVRPSGAVGSASGTSLAAPLISSLVAGLWQRYPDLTNKELITAIRNSASQSSNPDHLIGYGIPSYTSVVNYLERAEQTRWFEVYPNPIYSDSLVIKPRDPVEIPSCQIQFISADGKIILSKDIAFTWAESQYETSLKGFERGVYFLKITWKDKTFTHKLVKI
ncbi:MAG TPA: S8 family peptidase [Ohtaekwangia sp.]|nr:S8 family peptidase [Ohtaekwangia sp.]